ncbi:MAG: hypothetical protein AAGB05_05875 [Pseudomonadota bacterium]
MTLPILPRRQAMRDAALSAGASLPRACDWREAGVPLSVRLNYGFGRAASFPST